MKWSEFRQLDVEQRTDLIMPKLVDALEGARADYEGSFKDGVTLPMVKAVATLIMDIVLLHHQREGTVSWSQRPPSISDASNPFNNRGEELIGGLARLGPLCWGWRATNANGSAGAPRRGIFQIIDEHFRQLEGDVLFLCRWPGLIKTTTTIEAAKAFYDWIGKSALNETIESKAGAFEDRIRRLNPRK